ncbi:serine/threonine-protein kinase [Actinomadura chokoriensis]|uniref:Serine/threonine-protein kinase n=1 Tax=Actinomadura chokoriensis TaxID=454156 RepID=A0ABV4R8M5_9ACTN
MNDDATADGLYSPPPPLAGGPAVIGETIAGRWSVSGIRRGGQAWVLTADDVARGERRAIKVPLSGALAGDAELAMLFGLEPHPHIVSALDEVMVGDRRGIVFEFLPSTLADLLGRLHADPTATHASPLHGTVADMLQQVCSAMAHLSKRTETAHLDLKPSNVLIDGTGNAKVADFGLSKQIEIRDGRFPSAHGGTWAYAAPEVLRQERCDTRADIYSFGILLYEACTGKLPYPFPLAPDPIRQRAQLLEYHTSQGPRRRCVELYWWGQSHLTQVPVAPPSEAVAIILSSCLQELREKRSQSFSDLAATVQAGFQQTLVRTSPAPLSEPDRQRRELALSRALFRLGRFNEAVNHLNRLLAAPLPLDLFLGARQTALDSLNAAGRRTEADVLKEWT